MLETTTQAISNQSVRRGNTSEKMLLNWRHFHDATSTFTLYDTGLSTDFPFSYGTIPLPFNCYIQSVTITANKYLTYGTPTGTSATISIYKGLNTLVTSKTLTYTPSEGMVLDFNFEESAPINANEKASLRFQANGIWGYMATSIIIAQR